MILDNDSSNSGTATPEQKAFVADLAKKARGRKADKAAQPAREKKAKPAKVAKPDPAHRPVAAIWAKPLPKKVAKKAAPAVAKKQTKEAPAKPAKENKNDVLRELLSRKQGATIAQLMEATGWQAHSVRGWLSTTSRKDADKGGLAITSSKSDSGERIYRNGVGFDSGKQQ